MAYSSFTVSQIKEEFGTIIQEGVRFLPIDLPTIPVSQRLSGILEDLPWAIAVGTEKARSEVIINPILLEVRRVLQQKISVFFGEEFNDATRRPHHHIGFSRLFIAADDLTVGQRPSTNFSQS